jgi:hypothetical protein
MIIVQTNDEAPKVTQVQSNPILSLVKCLMKRPWIENKKGVRIAYMTGIQAGTRPCFTSDVSTTWAILMEIALNTKLRTPIK